MAGEVFSQYKFEELEIKKELKRSTEKLGFEQMTPIQAQAIPILLKGRDVIGQAQTGTGKTAAFGIPLLEKIDPKNKKLQAIILCPTRELAMQVANELRSFAEYMHDVKLLPVYGGQDIKRQIQGLKGTQIVVGTPGRVMDHMRRHTIKMDYVNLCILDEADEMLKMGFREDMEVILGAIEHPHQTCLFSATMPKEILDLTDRFQCNPEFIQIQAEELTVERIKQYFYVIKKEYKVEALLRLLTFHQYQKAMIFCNTKAMTDELVAELQKEGYPAEALHGDLNQKQRDLVMGHFRGGIAKVLVATDIAARGIDVDDVEAVFNYDIPQEAEYYVHRVGRTGRAGREGVSHTLCKSKELKRVREIETVCHTKMENARIPSSQTINEAKIRTILDRVSEVFEEEFSQAYLPVIASYCEEHNLDIHKLPAAFLKLELGDLLEELEIDLPEDNLKGRKSHRNREERRSRMYGRNRRDSREFRDRGERGERRERRRQDHDERRFWGEKDSRREKEYIPTKEERKKIRKFNKDISKRELRKAQEQFQKKH